MALTPQEIHQLDQEIFDFLYVKHLEANGKGEEFYFYISPHKGIKAREEFGDKYYYFFSSTNCTEITFWKARGDIHSEINVYVYKEAGKYWISCEIRNSTIILTTPDSIIDETLLVRSNEKISDLGKKLIQEDANWQKKSFETQFSEKKYFGYVKFYEKATTLKQAISVFLDTDKPKIDAFLIEDEKQEKEYSTYKNWTMPTLISKVLFETMLENAKFMFSKPQDNINKESLPLSLSRFFIRKYEAIDFLEITEIKDNTRWIFLTGENAAGKTSILTAIYNGLTKGREFYDKELSGFGYGVEVSKNGEYLQNIRGYAVNNLFVSANEKIIFVNETYDVVKFLYDRYKSKNRKYHFNLLVNILKEILPNLSRIEIDEDIEPEEYQKGVLFYEKDEYGNELGYVTFDKLALGYKNIIIRITTIILQLSNANERITEFVTPPNLYGIVIIDEFEQHLHPKMQRFLVEKLTTLFPKVQFIVSTHSPIPLLGAPKESVILHVERTKEKGITVQQLTEIDFSNLLPEALLSLVFDFDDFIPRKYDKMNPFETESDANEIIFDKMLKDKVQKLADKNGKKLADFFTKK